YIELSGINKFFDDSGDFVVSDIVIKEKIVKTKEILDETGLKLWSVHMPFSRHLDISIVDEKKREAVVAKHTKLLQVLEILKPEIILFHPSYYLDPPNRRDTRKSQMLKSAAKLDKAVQAIGATMVIENMLGPKLMKGDREWPLMRTVEETVSLFRRLPDSIYSAIDMNHISDPEKLIRAMGDRLKSVHISDGRGKAEDHYFPCSDKGENDWVEILSALDEVGYDNPFIYESAYEDEKDLVECYQLLYDKFVAEKY